MSCLVSIQKRLQVVETEGRANRYRLCRISCPKLAVGVAANGSQNYKGAMSVIDADQVREFRTLRVYQQVVLNFVDVSVREGVSFEPSILAKKCKQEVDHFAFHAILRQATENCVRPGNHITEDDEGLIR